jgi:hypothetical protein
MTYSRTVTATLPSYRPLTRRQRLGAKLHPTAVTDAWYAADCPPKLDASDLPLRVRLRWMVACWLRGVQR